MSGLTIPGGPSFGGYPQPPDVPCDPTGKGWRGPPGPVGPPGPIGPQGVPGVPGSGAVNSVAGKVGDVTLVHTDITDWATAINPATTVVAGTGIAVSSVGPASTVALANIGAGMVLGNGGSATASPAPLLLNPANFLISGGVISTSGTLGVVNLTSNVGLLMNGQPIINIGSNHATFVGIGAGYVAQTGTIAPGLGCSFFGEDSGRRNTNGSENTYIGQSAGYFGTTALHNTSVGQHSMGYLVTDGFCTAVGGDAMRNYASGTGFCTAIGASAMYSGGCTYSTAVGGGALTGAGSTVVIGGSVTTTDTVTLTFTGGFVGSPHSVSTPMTGVSTLAQAATAIFNACVADATISPIIGGSIASSVIDTNAIRFVWHSTDGTQNAPTGGGGTSTTGLAVVVTSSVTGAATEAVTIYGGNTGTQNLALGYQAMIGAYLTTGSYNIGLGLTSLYSLTTGSSNIAVGQNAGYGLTTGSSCVFIGSAAGQNVATTGNHIAIGQNALQNFAGTGGGYVAIGYLAMQNISTGSLQCVAIGQQAVQGAASSTATGITGIGHFAFKGVTSGSFNVGVGYTVGQSVTTGGRNALLGYATGSVLTTGSNNTIIGAQVASATLQTGSGNILIGVDSNTDTAASGTSNTLLIRGSGAAITPAIFASAINTTLPKVAIGAGGGSAVPVAGTDIPASMFMLWKNSTDSTAKLYYNDAGTLKSVALT